MPSVPGLRSPRDKVGRLVYFGRMLDKIRLHARGLLPPAYVTNLGYGVPRSLDGRCCTFLGVRYEDLVVRVLQGGSDEEILAWCHANGNPRSDADCELFNGFMTKRGWRDEGSELLARRIREFGLSGKPIETYFDLFDYDEGRVS